ncbi:MAG: M15 family metallopeptidase [Opitutus sp.]
MIRTPQEIAAIHRELGVPADYALNRRLQFQVEADPRSLVPVSTKSGREIYVAEAMINPWKRLQTTAAGEGVQLIAVSGFRSVDRQTEIIRNKLRAGMAIAAILQVNAAPGFSEHHTGRAIDIATHGSPSLEVEFERTDAFRWLNLHATSFGFRLSYPAGNPHEITYEPWHWCWHEKLPLSVTGA